MNATGESSTTNSIAEVKALEIMIIDDAQCMCHLYDILLRKHLRNVNTTLFFTQRAGSEAIGALKSGYKPDFSIIDIRINGVNGIDVWKELHERIPLAKFIFLTNCIHGEADYDEAVKLTSKDVIVNKSEINFPRDIMGRIPNLEKYSCCDTCIHGGDPTVCQVRIKG